jgi:phosphonate transport system substrate-binding protein
VSTLHHAWAIPWRRASVLLSAAALAWTLLGCAPAAGGQIATGERPPTFRVGLIPNQAPDRVKAQYELFRQYLEKTLAHPVETFVATDYAGIVEAMASDKLDMAYFGGLTYVQSELRADVYPIVTEIDRETKTAKYYSAIIVKADSPYQKIEELKGKKFAFGDISSTSGSLFPRIMLDRAGFNDFTDPRTFVYSGGHDATLAAVINGSVEGGGIERRIMNRAFDAGTFDRNQVRIIQEELVLGYPWVVRAKLDRAYVDRVVQAFLDIKDAELLNLMRADGYTRVKKEDYDEIRQQADRLGLRKK